MQQVYSSFHYLDNTADELVGFTAVALGPIDRSKVGPGQWRFSVGGIWRERESPEMMRVIEYVPKISTDVDTSGTATVEQTLADGDVARVIFG